MTRARNELHRAPLKFPAQQPKNGDAHGGA
jgi:hypothetical protein